VIKILSQQYSSRYGTPLLAQVDTSIFTETYFTFCMQCNFCHDSCCAFGADVDGITLSRLEAHADALEAYVKIPRALWLEDTVAEDSDFPGGMARRTRIQSRGCVFLDSVGRGCLIHSFALESRMDYHALKPMVCSLFPVTYEGGLLLPSGEVEDRSLVCLGAGQSLYRSARDELRFYFGDALIAELDGLEAAFQIIK